MSNGTLNRVIKDFGSLPLDDKEYAIDIIEKQLIEAKRVSIAKRASRAMANLKRGAVKKGGVKDLYKDLEID
jgi:ribosomal protein L31E